MLLKCNYCSTLVKSMSEENNIIDCSFCGKIFSVDEELQTFRLKRKQRDIRKNRVLFRRQEDECEQSCITVVDSVAEQCDLSDSGSTSSSKVNSSESNTLSKVDADDSLIRKRAKTQ